MTDREFLRHTVATLAYRLAKTLRGAPESFAEYRHTENSNSPMKLVAHIGDLFDWANTMLDGAPKWHTTQPELWETERERMWAALERFDDHLASEEPIAQPLTMIFQGPVSDALTHTGQLAMLRRLSGNPMKGESYARAEITIGRVGFEQVPADPKNEFD